MTALRLSVLSHFSLSFFLRPGHGPVSAHRRCRGGHSSVVDRRRTGRPLRENRYVYDSAARESTSSPPAAGQEVWWMINAVWTEAVTSTQAMGDNRHSCELMWCFPAGTPQIVFYATRINGRGLEGRGVIENAAWQRTNKRSFTRYLSCLNILSTVYSLGR